MEDVRIEEQKFTAEILVYVRKGQELTNEDVNSAILEGFSIRGRDRTDQMIVVNAHETTP